MRTVTTGAIALLLVATANAEYTLSLVDKTNGLSTTRTGAPGSFTVELVLESDGVPTPTSPYGIGYLGAQTALAPLPPGWAVSDLRYNIIEFDRTLIISTSLTDLIGIAADPCVYGAGFTSRETLLEFTLFAPTPGVLRLDDTPTAVFDNVFEALWVGPGDLVTRGLVVIPEPATLTLLAFGGLVLARRRRGR